MLTIVDAAWSDFKTIQKIAYQTWPKTYGEILCKNQLDYMLTAFYSESALEESVSQKKTSLFNSSRTRAMFGFCVLRTKL